MRYTINDREVSSKEYDDSEEDGIYRRHYENGNVALESILVNGKAHGTAKHYYKNGSLEHKTPWVNNKMHGIVKCYCNDGSLKSETPWVDDKLRPDLLRPENYLKRLVLLGE